MVVDVSVVLDVDVDIDRDGDLDMAAQALTPHTQMVPLTADAASMLSFQRLDVLGGSSKPLARPAAHRIPATVTLTTNGHVGGHGHGCGHAGRAAPDSERGWRRVAGRASLFEPSCNAVSQGSALHEASPVVGRRPFCVFAAVTVTAFRPITSSSIISITYA